MSTIKIPYFKDLNFNDLDDYYTTEIDVNGKTISLHLNLEEPSIDEPTAIKLKQFIEMLAVYDAANLKTISEDFASGDTVNEYINFHLHELFEEEILSFIDPSNQNASINEQMLSKIHLQQVWLYPHAENYLGIFDYSLGKDLTNHVVVISLQENGDLHHITWES